MTEEMRAAVAALGSPAPHGTKSVTSDLSIDESLLLHGIGWEPVELVTGVSIYSIPYGTFRIPFGQGQVVEITYASQAVTEAFRACTDRIRTECAAAGGHGVVGVEVEVEIGSLAARVAFTGTAVRPIEHAARAPVRPFVTDLSTRDFALLQRAGWAPLEIVYGASFVGAPIQGLRQTLAQAGQNVELVNLTQALQDAREKAMDRMQQGAQGAGASGVVDVSIIDGALGHSRHVLAFICYGTAVHLEAERHLSIEPELVVPLDEPVVQFAARSLR